MNKAFILTSKYYDSFIKDIFNKILNIEIFTIYNINEDIMNIYNNLSIDNLDYNSKIDLSCLIYSLNNDCNIIIDYNNRFNKYIDILKDLNYNFKYYNLNNNIINNYKIIKNINYNINIFKYIHYVIIKKLILHLIDNLQMYIRNNIGFEINEGSFNRIDKYISNNIYEKYNIFSILKRYYYYKSKLELIPIDKPKNTFKVGIISNQYINNELYYNYYIEKELSNKNISIRRYIDNNNYNKKIKGKYYLFNLINICKNNINYSITRNLYRISELINQEYDGILYIVKENDINDNISKIISSKLYKKYNIPIIYLVFNENINELSINNSIKVLYDMIILNKNIQKPFTK